MEIRPATAADRDALWRILEPTIRAGETYALPRDMAREDALAYWTGPGTHPFLAAAGLGTYTLRANGRGGADHVANCGFMVAEEAAGRGIARAMWAHAMATARALGFSAMQFNFVVASNTRAVRLWTECGFETVGRLPAAFRHPRLGPVDALVMFRTL